MLNKCLSSLLAILLLLIPAARTTGAKTQKHIEGPSIDQIKVQVAKLGTGAKARATITLKSGAMTKGYVSQAADDEFVIRDRKTDAPTTVRYADVAAVKPDRGHSTAKHLALGIGIGVGAFLGILLAVFAHLD